MATRTEAISGVGVVPRQSEGIWRDAWRRLRKNKLAVGGLVFVILLLLAGAFGPLIAPWPYYVQDIEALAANNFEPLPPFQDMSHILGTDGNGRDMLSMLLDGAQISLTVAFVVQIVILIIGVPIGAAAGWFGGRTDNLLMRFTDVIYAFPDLLFIILLSVAFVDTWFGHALNGVLLVFVAIGITSWVTVARLIRGQFLSLKETEFVEAARAIGVSPRRTISRHLIPNSISPVIVAVTLGIPAAILAEATLAFIGVGVQPPRTSWGSLIALGYTSIRQYPWLTLLPGLLIATALMSFTFLGDGLRDALDPKLKGKQ
jgi:ABC-type dipeptide/oligopeptide/nickel transport system permease subunit